MAEVLGIFICRKSKSLMIPQESIEVVKNRGLVGDRYFENVKFLVEIFSVAPIFLSRPLLWDSYRSQTFPDSF